MEDYMKDYYSVEAARSDTDAAKATAKKEEFFAGVAIDDFDVLVQAIASAACSGQNSISFRPYDDEHYETIIADNKIIPSEDKVFDSDTKAALKALRLLGYKVTEAVGDCYFNGMNPQTEPPVTNMGYCEIRW